MQPILRAKLKPQVMTDALIQMKATELQDKAAALEEKIRAEDGVGMAVDLIQQNCK